MRGLHLLIELAQRTTDERFAELARANRAKAEVEAALTAHEENLVVEGRFLAADPTMMAGFDAWSRRAVRTRSLLRSRETDLDRDESAARDALRSAFIDLKRLEIARDDEDRANRRAAARRADIQASEIYALAQI
jgi:hypothetical protein